MCNRIPRDEKYQRNAPLSPYATEHWPQISRQFKYGKGGFHRILDNGSWEPVSRFEMVLNLMGEWRSPYFLGLTYQDAQVVADRLLREYKESRRRR